MFENMPLWEIIFTDPKHPQKIEQPVYVQAITAKSAFEIFYQSWDTSLEVTIIKKLSPGILK